MSFLRKKYITLAMLLAIVFGALSSVCAQGLVSPYRSNESARSDKFTGGRIERAELVAGEPDIEITVDVPAFRLTLWQNGKEVKTYAVGVGRKDFPISIGEKQATEIIWNPDWVPPDSEWVTGRKGVRAGEIIRASDPRNPLGKVKIPLGYGYLIHQAASPTDLGNLVSHGCIRMLRTDLYDLTEKIVAARSLPVSAKKIANAKRTKNTVVAKLDKPLMVDVNYDTQVIEGGALHLYPDVYGRGTNTVEALRAEFESSGVDASNLDDATLKRMLARVSAKQKFVVSLDSIAAGRALTDGRVLPLVGTAAKKKVAAKKRAA
ncbi:MAG TPA: L,D-transpeptidase [Pyrinomonadaceae bacterium]|nr:L,D-transpeptidase [Pyrinomonadaceae bacterium]